ncbi:MAG: hypothetical protein GY858_02655 [Candidatus Omnitrophica bacterium]|nr:hypothetical protein [Candidatus Omnitrophota bacterium]
MNKFFDTVKKRVISQLNLKGIPKDQQFKFAGLIGAVIILIIIMFGNTKGGSSSLQEAAKPFINQSRGSDSPQEQIGEEGEKAALLRNESLMKYVGRKDPFIPSQIRSSSGGSSDLQILVGIIWDEKSPVAVFNDYVVSEGELIDGCRIIKISEENVLIDDNGSEINLGLGQGIPE